jgi:hypothetical protein
MDLKTVPIQMNVSKPGTIRRVPQTNDAVEIDSRQQPAARNIGKTIQGKGRKGPSRNRLATPPQKKT